MTTKQFNLLKKQINELRERIEKAIDKEG